MPAHHGAPGVTFASFQPLGLETGLRAARLAEELGFRSFWTAETTGAEAFATLAAVGAAAPSLDLGTGVLALQLRTPMLAAMGAATLASLHPQRRILLGVGISSPVVTSRWHGVEYGDRPVDRVREYVATVRACLSGERVDLEGEWYRAKGFRLGVRMGEQQPEIVIGALNQRMLRLAGEVADGVLLNYLPASAVPWCVEQVRSGERAAGRAPGSVTIHAYVHVGVCDPDSERARKAARQDLFSYAVVDAYAQAFSRAGFADEVDRLRHHHGAGEREQALASISDRMIDAIDILGDADHIASAVEDYRTAGVDHCVIMPLPWGPDRWAVIEDTLRASSRDTS